MRIPLILLLAGIAGLSIWLAGCATHLGHVGGRAPDTPAHDYSVRRDIRFTPTDWPEPLHGDAYLPGGEGPFPGVLVVHGGGWEGRERGDMDFVAERLAKAGFVAFNVSHRFAPEYQYPAQIHDLQHAVRWMRDHAGELSLDPSRIGGFGYSSGAHLVALLGLTDAGDDLDTPHGGPATRLQALVLGGMPSDLRRFPDGRLVRQFLGGPLKEKPGTYAAASPVVKLDGGDPPTFVYHAGWDMLVPPDHARRMYQALEEAGVPGELYIVKGHGHSTLFVLNRSAVRESVAFLERVLKAD